MSDTTNLPHRLRQQSRNAVQGYKSSRLLLEAADEIERLRSLFMQAGNELDDLKMSLRDSPSGDPQP